MNLFFMIPYVIAYQKNFKIKKATLTLGSFFKQVKINIYYTYSVISSTRRVRNDGRADTVLVY